MPRVGDGFQSKIEEFRRVRSQGEAAGRISQSEMSEALQELAPDARGKVSKAKLNAAADLFKSDVPLTRGAKELLKGFIEQYGPDAPSSSPGMGVRLAGSVAEVRAMLRDPSFLNSLFEGAFGTVAWSRSSSKEVGDVSKLDDGNFEVELKLVHWRHRGVMAETVIEMNPAGVMVDPGRGRASPAPGEGLEASMAHRPR